MSLVPAAIDGLLQMRYQPALQNVQVLDGPAAVWPEAEFIAIGLSPEDFTVPSTLAPADLLRAGEVADITCMARSFSGDVDIAPRRLRAYELFDAALAFVEDRRDFAGPGTSAEVTGSLYAPQVGTRGVIVDVVFTVRITRF